MVSWSLASFEFELTCLSPSVSVVFVYSQKVGRSVEHHLAKRDRCGQKEDVFSLLPRLCAVNFSRHRRAGDVLRRSPRSHVASVSNPQKIKKKCCVHCDSFASSRKRLWMIARKTLTQHV